MTIEQEVTSKGCDLEFKLDTDFNKLHYLQGFDIATILEEPKLGNRWLITSELVFSLSKGTKIHHTKLDNFMGKINEVVRKTNPKMRRDVTIPEFLAAKRLWKRMGIFPKVLGDPSYNPEDARSLYLSELRRQSKLACN